MPCSKQEWVEAAEQSLTEREQNALELFDRLWDLSMITKDPDLRELALRGLDLLNPGAPHPRQSIAAAQVGTERSGVDPLTNPDNG